MNKFEFGIRYCAGKRNKFGWDFKGSSNIKDLASRVMGAFMLRLRKDLLGLPPLTEGVVIIGENLTPALHALDTAILREHSPEDLMGYLAPNAHVATYRKELGKLKAKAALPFIKSIIEDTEDNLIVVTVHREVIKIISEGLTIYNPSIISGDVPTNKRLEIAKAWQADTTKRVMILNNIAGGLGFNLTKANRVVFVEFSWGYEDNRQVYDRAHRHGQENAVHVDYLIFKNSIDRKVIEVTERKRALGAYL
jgi:SWI/SNF-related matrix-associated actin-dependent regulator 1 of chromatin subfamily A